MKGVGPAKKKLFGNLGVETVEDLLYLFPRRYEDRTSMTAIKDIRIGEYQTVCGKVMAHKARRSWYTKKHVSEITIYDGKSKLVCVWFNQPYLERYFKAGSEVVLYGKADVYKDRIQMVAPEYEIIDSEQDKSLHVGRIVPIYPLTKGMTQRYLRRVIYNCLDKYEESLTDYLPVWLRNKHRLSNIKRSLRNIHFPESFQEQEEAHKRVSFEEFFLFQISVIKRRMSIVQKTGVMHKIDLDLINEFASLFPFPLTNAQNRVIREIAGDMQRPSPMLRLLQGDVGSGKTLVAFFGCLAAVKNKQQAAVMAPTEILARQHYENICRIMDYRLRIKGSADYRIKGSKDQRSKGLKENDVDSNPQILKSSDPAFSNPLILKSFNSRMALLTSSLSKKEKDRMLADIYDGNVDIVIGTHALLSERVEFKKLSFVVIDEQHKFGVCQRALLSEKGMNPDILVMTATPIPRTLSLTLFGDLDVSVIDEMPPGRGKIKTEIYDFENEADVYQEVKDRVKKGQQVYIIYPIIEESQKLDLKAAKAMFDSFAKKEFKEFRLGLVHGQMKRKESDTIMQQFKDHKIDILVATTVLEVGVDVPNANAMVIEHAERFGLAQLHQLRGRIGRGKEDAQCLLLAQPDTEDAHARLKAILSTTDGFEIAEQDLLIRGPGHYFGRHQHGLNELKYANPVTQIDILQAAREEAQDVVHKDPNLKDDQNRALKQIIQERYPGYLQNVEAG